MEIQKQWSSLFNIGPDHFGPDLLFSYLPVGVYICDINGSITYANAKSQSLWGVLETPLQKFCGSHKLYSPDGSQLLHQYSPVAACLRQALPIQGFELTMERPDGSLVDISADVAPVFDDYGTLVGAINCFHEITAQNTIKQALSKKSHELQEYIDNASIGLHWVDNQGIIKWANKAELDMLGYRHEEYVGQHISNFHRHADKINDILARLQADEILDQYESEMVCKDGSTRAVHISSSVYRLDGQFVHTRCFTVDVSSIKKAELQIRESEARFRMAANTAPVLIWMGETAKHRDFFNKCWLEFTGRSAAQQTGTGWMEGIHADDYEMVENTCESSYTAKSEYKLEYRLLKHTGNYRWVHSQGRPRYTIDGEFSGYIGTVIDIHEQKLRKEVLKKLVLEKTSQLQQANEKLERSNKELQDFAYVASHDLQEPLRKISMLGKMLVDRHLHSLSADGADLVHRMQTASNRMNELIEDLLNLSKISAVDQMVPVDLNSEIQGVLNDLESAITAKGAQIQLGDLYPMDGYGPQIRQLFQNLIGNALKFTRPGRPVIIRISSQLVHGRDSDLGLSGIEAEKLFQLIEIKDNGIGFDQQYARQIFEVFRRLHGRSEYSGTGIGLSIVKKVVESHHGYIIANGSVGEGASFQILLPMSDNK